MKFFSCPWVAAGIGLNSLFLIALPYAVESNEWLNFFNLLILISLFYLIVFAWHCDKKSETELGLVKKNIEPPKKYHAVLMEIEKNGFRGTVSDFNMMAFKAMYGEFPADLLNSGCIEDVFSPLVANKLIIISGHTDEGFGNLSKNISLTIKSKKLLKETS